MQDAFQEFREYTQELADLSAILSILSWDQETMMPRKGSAARARQRATAATVYHEKLTNPALASIMEKVAQTDPSPLVQRSLRELRRERDRALRLPRRLVQEIAETTALAYEKWVEARKESAYSKFQPWLEKVLRLKREEAQQLDLSDSLYQNLLDEYEPGMTLDQLETIFDELRPRLSRLLNQVVASSVYPNLKRIEGNFPIAVQDRFGRDVLTAMGFDWEAGRLDRSPHPFCSGFSPLDVRITTRYAERDFCGSLFGMIHEGGHALYEQGLDTSHQGLPVCEAISLGVHESQSRLWENQVGRSRAFWQYWLPHLREAFPRTLDVYSLDEFVLAINLVEPSPIRVTADEITYGLHIILRFELEKDLLQGDVDTKSLPEAWNQKMEDYLNLTPANDSDGVLQDIHWSHGLLGYFPTYLLGNLYAAQLMHQATADIPDLEGNLAAGRLLPLREWLRTNVHQIGRTLSAEEMIVQVTGETLSPRFFSGYLDAKFGELYQL